MDGISVIIPTLNRGDFLKQTVDCLLKQEFGHDYEIIIVDQSEEPDGNMLAYQKGYPRLKYHHITFFKGLPEARNFGWQNAKYNYVLYLDDDILCEANLLTEHYKYLSDPDIGIVAGGITEKHRKNTDCKTGKFNYFKAVPHRGFHIRQNGYVDHGGGGNFSVKKHILDEVAGIDENLTKGAALHEETDFCLRAKNKGYKAFFNYDAHVHHLAASSGGCRVEDTEKYLFSLSRNRSIVITRHLKWYHKLTAYLYLLKLMFAFSMSYKKAGLISSGIQGIKEGRTVGKQPSKCTFF